MIEKLLKQIEDIDGKLSVEDTNLLLDKVMAKHPMTHNPVSQIRYIHVDDIQPNDYNPNAVAKQEMGLLYTSIKHDGYTQPTVTIWDEEIGKYVIVDGFHRYFVMKAFEDIYELNGGYLPIVVIDKGINDRMASTVRHNRARGKHSLTGMGNIVLSMLENGATDEEVCNELGLEVDELVRLKYTTGIAKLFEDRQYSHEKKMGYQMKREFDPLNPNSVEVIDEGLEENYKNVKLEWKE